MFMFAFINVFLMNEVWRFQCHAEIGWFFLVLVEITWQRCRVLLILCVCGWSVFIRHHCWDRWEKWNTEVQRPYLWHVDCRHFFQTFLIYNATTDLHRAITNALQTPAVCDLKKKKRKIDTANITCFFVKFLVYFRSQLNITDRNSSQESQLSCQGQPVRATSHKLRQLLLSGAVGNLTPINTAHII